MLTGLHALHTGKEGNAIAEQARCNIADRTSPACQSTSVKPWGLQISILHSCRHPSVVLMLGAWLGQYQLYMVMELLDTDLRKALNDPDRQAELRWENRYNGQMQRCQTGLQCSLAELCSDKQLTALMLLQGFGNCQGHCLRPRVPAHELSDAPGHQVCPVMSCTL